MKNNGKAMAKAGKKTFLRLIRTIFGFFPVLMPLVLTGILFNAIVFRQFLCRRLLLW